MIPAMQTSAADPIDTRQIDFLSYGPPFGARRPGMEELRVAVEPDSGDRFASQSQFRPVFPLRRGKVQRPLLPDDTLRRDRLLDWMAAKVRCRIIYVVAEAGFGKTTLVADFTRRSRIRTFWYRLDEDDTDGLVFLRYVVASCRTVDPGLFRQTEGLLTEASIEPISFESVIDTFIAEFEQLGDAPSMLVLDDYYLAENVASIRSTVERLIARAPANLTLVFATRRTPPLSVATLRARAELAELGKDELRFEPSETRQLLAGAFHHPLEADVLEDVQARTHGWAASLQLLRTAVEGKTPVQVRTFVRSMSGAEGHIYDYLAQEVVGDLDPDLRHYLPRAALLDEVEVETSARLAGVPEETSRHLIAEAQRVGLLARSEGAASSWRLHPLVREFLLAGLESEIGEAGIVELHRQAAAAFELISWRLAARHWAAAGDAPAVRRVLSAAVPAIMGTGDLGVAEELMNAFPDPEPNPWYELLRARVMLGQGHTVAARDLARQAAGRFNADTAGTSVIQVTVALTDLTAAMEASDTAAVRDTVERLIAYGDEEIEWIARSSLALYETSDSGDLDEARSILERTIAISRRKGHRRFEGVGLLNLACVLRLLLERSYSLQIALEAIDSLASIDSPADLASARLNAAAVLADIGEWDAAVRQIETALARTDEAVPTDTFLDAALICAQYGDPVLAAHYLDASTRTRWEPESSRLRVVATAAVEHAQGNHARALEALAAAPEGRYMSTGLRSAQLALQMQLESLVRPDHLGLPARVDEALAFAAAQKAWLHWYTIKLVQVCHASAPSLSAYVRNLGEDRMNQLSIAADVVAKRLDWLDGDAFALVANEVHRRPERWRPVLRRLIDHPAQARLHRAVDLLELIGSHEDVNRLRDLSRRKRLGMPNAGRPLIRRLAPVAFVEDLGRLSVRVGERQVPSGDVRRKILSLLGYLITRPQHTATREQILEALWPGMGPDSSANSLNQTTYFLRRILEEGYDEETSPGYLVCRGDFVTLDNQLVLARSTQCHALLDRIRRGSSPEAVLELSEIYTGRFGLDFVYDDWASAYRDNLHASYLERVERSVLQDAAAGCFDRAICLAQRALMADPEADQIELLLLRLYRRTGAVDAAQEQYGHYASVMREQLGVEPPPLEDL
jgi:DNA-binding SARP family transcriptional activator/tetratricopeptide (TPR) repeat protein